MHEDFCAGIHFKSFTWIPGRKMLNCMSIFNFKETAKANFQSCCTWRLFPLSWPKFHSDFSNRCYRKTRADFLANTMYLLCVFHSVSNFLVVLMLYCFLLLLFCFICLFIFCLTLSWSFIGVTIAQGFWAARCIIILEITLFRFSIFSFASLGNFCF